MISCLVGISKYYSLTLYCECQFVRLIIRGGRIMEVKKIKVFISRFFTTMLIVAIALFCSGCSDKKDDHHIDSSLKQDVIKLGEGEKQFLFEVVSDSKEVTYYEISTDKEIVGEALIDNQLIDGEDGEFGLYVKSVNGIVADYEKTHTYWAFYENNQMALKGVDQTYIEEGVTYSFRVEK